MSEVESGASPSRGTPSEAVQKARARLLKYTNSVNPPDRSNFTMAVAALEVAVRAAALAALPREEGGR